MTGRRSCRVPRAGRIVLAAAMLALSGAGSHAQTLDAVSAEAARSLDADVRAYRRKCPGEAIAVSVQPAPVNPAVVARIVSLAAYANAGSEDCGPLARPPMVRSPSDAVRARQ